MISDRSIENMRGIDGVDSQNIFPKVEMPNARGHSFKVSGGMLNGDIWGKVNDGAWSILSDVVIETDSIVALKKL